MNILIFLSFFTFLQQFPQIILLQTHSSTIHLPSTIIFFKDDSCLHIW